MADDAEENPAKLQPSTGTVSELRAVTARVADTFGDFLDEGHDWLYRRVQYFIEDVDTWFAEKGVAPLVVPVSPLRIDFGGEFLHKEGGFGLTSIRDFDATLRVPNLEHRLRFFITNDSIQEAPVVDPSQQPNPVRAGLRLTPVEHVEVEVGAHAKIWPSAFGTVRWARDWSAGSLHLYPFIMLGASIALFVSAFLVGLKQHALKIAHPSKASPQPQADGASQADAKPQNQHDANAVILMKTTLGELLLAAVREDPENARRLFVQAGLQAQTSVATPPAESAKAHSSDVVGK